MNNQIQIFNNPQFGDIRTITTEAGEPLFCLSDLCAILGLQSGATKNRLNEGGISSINTPTYGGVQKMIYVNEPNLYKAIFQSRKKEAEAFTEWVTSEVLPSIRKNGGYIATKPEDTAEIIMARAVLVADAAIKSLEAKNKLLESCNQDNVKKIEEMKPKVLFAESVEASGKSILIGELAKIISQNGFEIGQNRLFAILRKREYLCTKGESYNIPTQKAMELGLFEIKKQTINQPGGRVLITTTTKVTPKGQIYFVNKFLKRQAA